MRTTQIVIPKWFRETSVFKQSAERERREAEAQRTELAADRAALLAEDRKNAPKRSKAVDAATARIAEAEQALKAAREARDLVASEWAAKDVTHRVSRIEGRIRELAAPCIAESIMQVVDTIDRVMHDNRHAGIQKAVSDRLAALRAAQRELDALYLVTGIDTDAECARILAGVGTSPQVVH